jgi:hypothetical protein
VYCSHCGDQCPAIVDPDKGYMSVIFFSFSVRCIHPCLYVFVHVYTFLVIIYELPHWGAIFLFLPSWSGHVTRNLFASSQCEFHN